LSIDQLLGYFNDLLVSNSWSAVKLDLYGLKFFYSRVLNRTWEDIPVIKPPKTSRIPDILSIEQLHELLTATSKLSYRVFFSEFWEGSILIFCAYRNNYIYCPQDSIL